MGWVLKKWIIRHKINEASWKNYEDFKNADKEDGLDDLVSFVLGGYYGGIAGTIYTISTVGLSAVPIEGFACLVAGAFGSIYLNNLAPRNASCADVFSFKMIEEETKKERNENETKEFISKFVYFKKDKIIGFIKFKEDITPPVNGYYFNCKYNLKIYAKTKETFLLTTSQQKEKNWNWILWWERLCRNNEKII